MQNAYTILRGASNPEDIYWHIYSRDRLPLILRISEPIGSVSKEVVDEFQRYVGIVQARVGWEFLDNVMGDPRNAVLCIVMLGYAMLALPSDI